MVERLAAWRAVVRLRLDPASMFGLGLDPVGIGEPPTFPERLDAAFQCLATSERQDRVNAFRRELLRGTGDVAVPAVDRDIRTQLAHEGDSIRTGRGRQHPRATQLRELDGEHAHATGRAP